jgi:hypothetical protein
VLALVANQDARDALVREVRRGIHRLTLKVGSGDLKLAPTLIATKDERTLDGPNDQ